MARDIIGNDVLTMVGNMFQFEDFKTPYKKPAEEPSRDFGVRRSLVSWGSLVALRLPGLGFRGLGFRSLGFRAQTV